MVKKEMKQGILCDGENMLINNGNDNIIKLVDIHVISTTISIDNNINHIYSLGSREVDRYSLGDQSVETELKIMAKNVSYQSEFKLDPKKLTYYERIIMGN